MQDSFFHSRPGRAALPLAAVLLAGLATLGLAAPRKAAPRAARPAAKAAPNTQRPTPNTISLKGPWSREYPLKAGETVEISVALDRPSALPSNGRVGVQWTLAKPENPADVVSTPTDGPRKVDAHGIYTKPTADWRKVLHALDGDVYLVYRAPVSGTYRLALAPVTDEKLVGDAPRWREKGGAPELFPLPDRTPWPQGTVAPVSVRVDRLSTGTQAEAQKLGALIEAEPNDTPEQAQPLDLEPNDDIRTYEITGTSDDIEYFDNGKMGQSGDDWFRVELKAAEPRLVTAQVGIPGQFIAARIRTYRLAGNADPSVKLGALLPVEEWNGTVNKDRLPYTEGKQTEVPEGQDPNERAHQQEEPHRTEISRILQPGQVYFFRVEANAPAYQLQLRVLKPAPYADPRMAIRQAMYQHVGQVDAWLSNRPRGASVDRRIRDTGNLLGTQCMSCHTQSGVWGPSAAIKNGYRVENVQNYWKLLNIMYECLRPTNELKDAANNTSLATLDIGDGPAGTRAAGFNIVQAEKNFAPKKLHGKQQVRTANYVTLTGDPGGINAAGPGSNVGQNIVKHFAGEILKRAWKDTGDPKYFRLLEKKAQEVLAVDPRFTDDLGVRLWFFGDVVPLKEYPSEAKKAADAEQAAGKKPSAAALDLEKIRARLAADEARLRALQNEDGSWGFDPGKSPDGGQTWRHSKTDWDPSPTSLAVIGLNAAGHGTDDPAIAKGVQALLRMQDPNGRWNRASITGFVPTAYVLQALGRLYPVQPYVPKREEFVPKAGETTLQALRRVQALALTAEPKFADLMLQAAKHPHTLVRYWALIGLGATHTDAGLPVLMANLKAKEKPLRDAAVWAFKQTLLDDRGWDQAFAALANGDDRTREGVMMALGMRADAVMPGSKVGWDRITKALARGMNDDPHPAVRAYASKAAWQWWIWNPPVRPAVNAAWVRMLERPETHALVEHNNRYSSQALFIANGHKANGSKEHQYKELATLFETLQKRLEAAQGATKSLLARRLVAVAGTFFATSGGDGGPGQMGYITPSSGDLFGDAALVYLREVRPTESIPAIRAGLEGASNVPHRDLQEYLIDYALKAPEELRREAAAAVSDPRSAMLQAATELVEPLIQQVKRGAAEPARRPTLSDPVLKLFGGVNWVIPADQEQQRHFFDLMIPKFPEYYPREETAADPAKGRAMDASWYLADKMGDAVAANPDLHHEMVFRKYFPEQFKNPLERHFWVRSVPWILEYKAAPPKVGEAPAASKIQNPKSKMEAAPPDPALITKDRALQLYLDALKPEALPQTRAAAIRIANATAVRQNPEVILALTSVLEFEKDEQLKKVAENVVKQGNERFVPELVAALKAEGRPGKWLAGDGKPDPRFLEDITYFRDYIIPEMARVKRSDQASCLGCHAVPGRVPSYILKPVDEFGYISVADLLHNYRESQSKINLKDVEKSKLLRKPLNVQDGIEEGHQGGRRYLPTDDGYLMIKRWAENQPKLIGAVMGAFDPFRPLFQPLARLIERRRD